MSPDPRWDCRRVDVPPGPEDFELDRWSTPPRLIVASHPPVAIPIVGEALGTPVPLQVDPAVPRFEPIGISLVRRDDETLLYAINKDVGIEVFRVEPAALRHLATLESPLIVTPNEVVATPSGHVYVSNMFAHAGLRGRLSALFRTRSGNVVHFDEREWRVAAGPIGFGNGMLVSPDGRRFWVAAFAERKLYRYDRDPATGRLGNPTAIETGGFPDNLQWDRYPRIAAAVHPSYVRTSLHLLTGGRANSPSSVETIDGISGTVDELFRDDGQTISAASTALRYGSHLYVSQIRRGYLLDCTRTN
jgi:hypothetical protein